MRLLRRLWQHWRGRHEVTGVAPSRVLGPNLIERLEIRVEARCPCGMSPARALALQETAECGWCGRRFGIRSLEYFRRGPDHQPSLQVTVGYVVTRSTLEKLRPARGVH